MKRRVWSVLAIALLTLVGIEAGMRVVADRLPPPSDWHYEGVEQFVDSMETLRQAGISSDVVIAGTSLAHRIRAPLVEDGLETVAYAHNLSLYNAHTPVQRRWLLEEVLPRLEPGRVIWGIASLDFNGGRPHKEIDLYESARAAKPGLSGEIDRIMADLLMTARHRQEVRDLSFVRHLVGARGASQDPGEEPLDAVLERPEIIDRIKTEVDLANLRQLELHDFFIGEREAADFIFTLEEMRRRDIEVIIVLMPASAEYLTANDRGRTSHTQWISWVKATAGELGVPVLDYSSALPEEYFGDYIHLDPPGADLLTEMIVADVRALGW